MLYISVWVISPPLAYGGTYRTVAIGFTAIWIAIELAKRPGTFLAPTLATFCAMFVIFYTAITAYLLEGSAAVIRNFNVYIFLLFLIFFESYRKRNLDQLRVVVMICLGLMAIWMVITLKAMIEMPNVARLLVRSSPVSEFYMSKGVGGYSLVYSALIVIPILVHLLKSKDFSFITQSFNFIKKVSLYLLGLATLLLTIFLVIRASYVIALFLMTLSIPVTLFVKKKSGLVLLMVVTLPILMFVELSSIFETASEVFTGSEYSRKFDDIALSLDEGKVVGTLQTRQERYLRSIGLALQNPIVGTLSPKDIGNHSSILDGFAKYGFLVGLMYAYCIFYLPLRYLKYYPVDFGMKAGVFIIVAGVSLFNNVPATFGFMLFLFYPTVVNGMVRGLYKQAPTPLLAREEPETALD